MRTFYLGSVASFALMLGSQANAQVQAQAADPAAPATAPVAKTARGNTVGTSAIRTRVSPDANADIVVTARRLEEARAAIQPALGATSYTITNATIQALPGGDNQQFNQVLLQLPGVVQDGFGQFHVRDDHNNLQYRINGTILPEGIAVFGQTLTPRIVQSVSLLTGALPAQYGLRTAAIVDITTKSGLFNDGGSVSLYGGSHDTIQPSIEYGGSTGATNYFVSGQFTHNRLGIESVDGSSNPVHDKTNQEQLFGYVDHILDGENKISFVGGYANQAFQIPNPRGLTPDGTYTVNGSSDYLSDDLREHQLERTGFGQLAFLHHSGPFSIQASLFARYSLLRYTPDTLGELLFNGQAQNARKKDVTEGGQVDGSYRLSGAHTLRFGGLFEHDRGTSRTSTMVFPVDGDGNQSGEPIAIADDGAKTELTESVYLQDEWSILPRVTLNYGVRFDHYDGYRAEHQFSPRVNAVWRPTDTTTIHAGYSRYFSPAPFELVATQTVAKFDGTSAAAPPAVDGVPRNTTPFAERQNYFDVGFQQKVAETGLSFGVDAYHRRSHQLIDEGQFGAPIILTPFNYARGRIDGIETNVSFARGPWLAYANFAYAKAQGRNITSSQFNFDPGDLAYIRTHYIYLDHDQTYTASGGVSYAFHDGALDGLKLGADVLYGSGLRTDGEVPNGAALKSYAQVNLTTSYRLARAGIDLRLDVINVGDHVYEIRDGSGVGVGAPQYGPRRGFFFGVSKDI